MTQHASCRCVESTALVLRASHEKFNLRVPKGTKHAIFEGQSLLNLSNLSLSLIFNGIRTHAEKLRKYDSTNPFTSVRKCANVVCITVQTEFHASPPCPEGNRIQKRVLNEYSLLIAIPPHFFRVGTEHFRQNLDYCRKVDN